MLKILTLIIKGDKGDSGMPKITLICYKSNKEL